MPCYEPLRGAGKSPAGARIAVPCGSCIGCRVERARQWAVRLVHEAKMHEASCFVTLTFSPEFLPKDGSLSVDCCQRFLKRLRKKLEPLKIRFFLCGEYGEQFGRPHYHMILFGYDFPDKVRLEVPGEYVLYRSDELDSVWGFGYASIGAVSFDSACYVANYATKKIRSNMASERERLRGRKPEFLLMSRRPGIGRSWIDKFESDVYPSDECIVRGVSVRPPRYYDQVFRAKAPGVFSGVLDRRLREAEKLEDMVLASGDVVKVAPSRNARRLAVREVVAKAKLSLKSRRLGD